MLFLRFPPENGREARFISHCSTNRMIVRTYFPSRCSGISLICLLLTLMSLTIAACGGGDRPGDASDSTEAGDDAAGQTGDPVVPAGNEVASSFEEAQPVAPEVSYTLRVRPKVGDVYSYRVMQSGVTEFEGLQATEEAAYNFTQRITGVNEDGSFTVEMRYDSIRAMKAFPAGVIDSVPRTVRYDTRGKIDTTIPEALQAKALIGKKVSLTLSNEGEVREISNLEPIVSAILGKYRDSLPPRSIEQIRAGVRLSVFQAIVQQLFLQSKGDSAISVGSEWVRRDSVPLVMPIATVPSRATVTYKVVEIKEVNDEPLGRVTVSLSTVFPRKNLEDETGKATIDEASATGSGDALLNLNTGFPVRKSTKIEVKLKLTGSAKSGPGAGRSTTLAQGKSTTTLVELLNHTPAK